jgi:hypothetical protein
LLRCLIGATSDAAPTLIQVADARFDERGGESSELEFRWRVHSGRSEDLHERRSHDDLSGVVSA